MVFTGQYLQGERRRSSTTGRPVSVDPIMQGFQKSLTESGIPYEEQNDKALELLHESLYEMLRKFWYSPVRSLAIYELACDIPSEPTRKLVGERENMLFGNVTLAECSTPNAVFIRAWHATTLEPRLVKISRSGIDVDRECQVWKDISRVISELAPDRPQDDFGLAGPFTRLSFHEDPNIAAVLLEGRTPMTKGVLMPQYTGTLADLPIPLSPDSVFQIYNDLLEAAKILEMCQICHCDIKLHNVFLDNRGRRFIADYGCAVRFGSQFDSFTEEYLPKNIREDVFNNIADRYVDLFCIAISCLRLLNVIDDTGNFTLESLLHTIKINVLHAPLKNSLSSLFEEIAKTHS